MSQTRLVVPRPGGPCTAEGTRRGVKTVLRAPGKVLDLDMAKLTDSSEERYRQVPSLGAGEDKRVPHLDDGFIYTHDTLLDFAFPAK